MASHTLTKPSRLDGLFDSATCCLVMPIRETCVAYLFAGEASQLSSANAVRRREFGTGRYCARLAMRRLGLPDMPILVGPGRAPVFPKGVVGSISHSATQCAAVVALRESGVASIGVDIEVFEPLKEEVVDTICTRSERAWLRGQSQHARDLLATAIFSAKECVYKCQYSMTGEMLDFDAIEIRLNLPNGRYVARLRGAMTPEFHNLSLEGRLAIIDRHIVTAVTLKDGHVKARQTD